MLRMLPLDPTGHNFLNYTVDGLPVQGSIPALNKAQFPPVPDGHAVQTKDDRPVGAVVVNRAAATTLFKIMTVGHLSGGPKGIQSSMLFIL